MPRKFPMGMRPEEAAHPPAPDGLSRQLQMLADAGQDGMREMLAGRGSHGMKRGGKVCRGMGAAKRGGNYK